MKKYTILILILLLWAIPVFGANTYSIDLELDSNQYLSIAGSGYTNIPAGNGARTIEAWVKLESSVTYSCPVVFGERALYKNWEWYIDPDGKQMVGIYGESSSLSNTAIADNTWTHIAITYNGTTLTFYINGVADGTDTFANTVNTGVASPLTIGMNNDGTSYDFDGLIDEVRIWNDVRTQSEINDNKSVELNGNEAGLVGYWKLNNGLLDETASDNDLTNNNSAVFSTDVPFVGATSIPQPDLW